MSSSSLSSSSICLRCLTRSLAPLESSFPPNAAQRAAFSTSSPLARVLPPKKKNPAGAKGVQARTGRTLRLTKNTRVATARPPVPGERKAYRKKVVLSNANALDVQGLEDLTALNVSRNERLQELQGKVMGFKEETVEALRALEAFKAKQGWSLFRRPAGLVRKQAVELGALLQRAGRDQATTRMVIFGEARSGKSVLQLQGMAMAQLQGWITIHFPEAREMSNAQTSYLPFKTPEGETIYIQPHYTASILQNIAKANRAQLSKLRLSKQHQFPIPIQSNISLARLVDLGANDVQLAYPIWQALLSELTARSQPEKEGLQRPPVFVSLDGVDHIMRNSAYLNAEANPVHAHELAIVRDFTTLLSGKTALPNGGMVLAATSGTDVPSAPTMKHYLARKHAEACVGPLLAARASLRKQAKSAGSVQNINMTAAEDLSSLTFPEPLARQVETFQRECLRQHDGNGSSGSLRSFLYRFEPKLPEWNPYEVKDGRVAEVMETVEVKKVEGLSKEEARAVMEYYARSGMMRGAVTEGLVGEKWTLSGGGIIGELEKGAVTLRF